MSQGKNVPLAAKGAIEELVKGCKTLEELRELERQKTEELADKIMKMRHNIIRIFETVTFWRRFLNELSKDEPSYMKKIKAIYPCQGMNCLVLLFYDSEFIKNSSLKLEIVFAK